MKNINLLNKIKDHASCIMHPASFLHRASILLLMLLTMSVGQMWGVNYSGHLYVLGENLGCGWTLGNAYEMSNVGDNVYVWQGYLSTTSVDNGFKFVKQTNSWLPAVTATEWRKDIVDGGEYDLRNKPNDNNDNPDNKFTVPSAGYYRLTVNLSTMKMKVESISISTYKSGVYILTGDYLGNKSDWNSTLGNAPVMVNGDNEVFYRVPELFNSGTQTRFKILRNGRDWGNQIQWSSFDNSKKNINGVNFDTDNGGENIRANFTKKGYLTMHYGNQKVYATFEVLKHKVTFNSNGGSDVDAQDVDDGAKAICPVSPTRDGYVFAGWKKSGSTFDFNTSITEDITLVAQWEAWNISGSSLVGGQGGFQLTGCLMTPNGDGTFTRTFSNVPAKSLSFKLNKVTNGSGTWDGALGNPDVSVFTANTNPVITNSSDSYSNINFTTTKPSNITITTDGKNVQVVVTYLYQVTYKDGDATIGEVQTIAHGGTAQAPADPSKIGYDFVGWDYTGAITSDKVINAQWAIKTYTATFGPTSASVGKGRVDVYERTGAHSDESESFGDVTLTSGVTGNLTYGKCYIFMPIAEDGCEFVGWYGNVGGTGAQISLPNPITFHEVDRDITLYAEFRSTSAATYTVTLDDDGEYDGNGNATATYGGGLSNIVAPIRTGYSVEGYYNTSAQKVMNADGTLNANVDGYTDGDAHWIYENDVTLYAHWTPIDYTITYDNMAGATNFDAAPATYTIESADIALGTPSKTGYDFAGWKLTNAEGAGVTSIAHGSTGNKTLWATWTPTNYTITYNVNGGDAIATGNYNVETATFALPTPNKTGFAFEGWFDNESLTGSAITQIERGTTGNKTFWAKWRAEVCVYVLKELADGYVVPGVVFAAQSGYKLWAWADGERGKFLTEGMSNWDSRPSFSATMTDANGNTWYKIVRTNESCSPYAVIVTTGSTNIFSTESNENTVDGAPATKWQFTGSAWIVPTSDQQYTAKAYTSNPIVADVKYSVTVSAGDHGSVIGAGEQQVGTNPYEIRAVQTAVDYVFAGWEKTGEVSIADASRATTTITATGVGTVTATWRQVSGWYLAGNEFGGWGTDPANAAVSTEHTNIPTGHPFVESFRGIAGYYYLPVSLHTGNWFKPYKASAISNGKATGQYYHMKDQTGDIEIDQQGGGFIDLYKRHQTGAFKVNANQENKWLVLNTNDGHYQIRLMNPTTYYNVTVTGATDHGSYTLADSQLRVRCSQYSNNDTYVLKVTATDGYVPSLTVNGEAAEWKQSADNVYTYTGKPSDAPVALNVSYTQYFSVTYGQNLTAVDGASNAILSGNTVAEGTSVTFTAADRVGYTFNGFYSDSEFNTLLEDGSDNTYTTTINAATTVYAKYTPITYSITYNTMGGAEVAAGEYTVETETFSLPVPTKSGYAFRGWYTNEACTEGKTTEIAHGSTGDREFFAKWKQEGWYLNWQDESDTWHNDLFVDGQVTISVSTASHNYPMEVIYVQHGVTDRFYKNGNWMPFNGNSENWEYTTSADRHGFTSTIAGNYLFTMTVNGNSNPVLTMVLPQFDCTFNIPALVNTLQASTVSFTPTVVNYDVTGYELYYTNDGGANWTSCAGVSEREGVYSYTNTFTTDGTYQLKVVVKNGDEQVGDAFVSDAFTVVAPAISIAVSDRPRQGGTVTVTPTVTGLQAGTYHYCWSIVDQSIEFTDNQNGTWSFIAPEAGTYTLRLEVKSGSDCSAAAIVSKDQELTILGNSVTVNAGLQYAFWQGVKVYYNNASHNMTDMGTDRNGVHWFTAEIPADKITWDALFFNSVDDNPKGQSAQTSNFTVPADNTCYLIKSAFTQDAYGNRQCEATTCQGAPEAIITSADHVVAGGTYQILAKYYMIPGNVTYEYSVNSGAVSVTDGKFVANEGTYTITVTVTGERGITATSDVFTLTCSQASVSAGVDKSNVNLNDTVRLSATPTNMTNPTYQWYVKQPGTTVWTTLSGYNSNSAIYIVKWNGDYQFKVEATEDGVTVTGTTVTVTVTVPEKWIKFRHADETGNPDGNDSEAKHWGWRQMVYNAQDGCYWYLGYKSGSGVNICATATDDCGWKSYSDDATFFTIEDGVINNAAVYFVYNPDEDHMYLKKAADYYRVRSNAETGVYYSNVVALAGAESKDVSFFATKGANSSLELEKLVGNAWTKQGENLANEAITAGNVYTAKLSSTSLTNVKAYTGNFWVYSDAAGDATANVDGNKMQRFNNVDEAEFYNHYKCVWLNEGDKTWNTGGTVGNAINHNLAVTLPKEDRNTVSVRYAYNPETNHFSRAYLAGATGGSEHTFLVVYGTNITEDKVENPKALTARSNDESTCQAFKDGSDWVYTTYIRATNPATIKLAALNNDDSGNWQFLLDAGGSEATSRNIYGAIDDGEITTLRFLVTYDFKTNRVIAAWMPDGTEVIDHPVTIDADLVVTRSARKENNPLLFTLLGDGQVKLIRKIITVVTIDRDSIFDSSDHSQLKHGGYGDRLFQISLPYDVKLSEITGLENYGEKVVLQSYRGDLRALMSWQSHIETFWSNIVYNSKAKLEANNGYYISHLWNYDDFTDVEINKGEWVARKRIFFPSEVRNEGYIIGPVNKYEPTTFAPLTCNVAGRGNIDSNWRLIGLPGFFPATPSDVNPENVTTGTNNQSTNEVTNFSTPYWVYDWNDATNTYTVYRAKNFRFEPTKAYFVQYKGTVSWGEPIAESTGGITVEGYPVAGPSAVAARSAEKSAQGGEYKLVLENSEEEFVDQTYVILDAQHNDSYEAGADFEKMFTAEASLLYSEAGGHQLAANMLADTTTVVALGTSLPEPGEYTIHLGQMSAGAQLPVLYDAELGRYTALTQQSYTFSGVAGKQSGRFYLIFGYKAPSVTTGVDAVEHNAELGGVEKFFHNGTLYILRDGHLYDAQGHVLK